MSLPIKVVKEIAAQKLMRESITFWIALALATGSIALTYGLLRSRRGLALTAIRDSEPAAESVGVDNARTKYLVYVAAAFVTGLTGALDGCTEATVLGPFHMDGAPRRALGDDICKDGKGIPCHVSGRVTDVDGKPLAGATLDVRQTNADGRYDVQQPGIQPEMNLRGRFFTDPEGRYAFRTVKPVSYPVPTDGPVGDVLGRMGRHAWRPAHIHFIVSKSSYRRLVTHIFAHDDPWIDSDAVFGVKESLLVEFREHDDAVRARELGVETPFCTAGFDVRLAREG